MPIFEIRKIFAYNDFMPADNDILNRIVDAFVQSNDFNGICASNLSRIFTLTESEVQARLSSLISVGKVNLAFESHSTNPHIKRLPDLPVDVQLTKLNKDELNSICVYPTGEAILAQRDLRQYDDRPYTRRLSTQTSVYSASSAVS
jgi:hypothetical protein